MLLCPRSNINPSLTFQHWEPIQFSIVNLIKFTKNVKSVSTNFTYSWDSNLSNQRPQSSQIISFQMATKYLNKTGFSTLPLVRYMKGI